MSKIFKKPQLSFWQIWNMSFGFLGVQIGYSLQNANTSRILSAIGADPHNLSLFWLAAPLAGLFVQPIVGLSSDKTWTRLGRRIPFILGGAIVSALAMFFMPNSEHFAQLLPAVFFGAMMLLFMDVSFNVTMQPFRALVSDMVDESQRNKGYAIQSFLINVGAVVGSLLPFLLTNVFHVANEPGAGQKVAPTVIWAFYFGGGVLLLSVLWTALRTKEYPPEEYAKYNNLEDIVEEKVSFMDLLKNIPLTMKQLAITQFFSWFALFLMWVYTTQGISEHVWKVNTWDLGFAQEVIGKKLTDNEVKAINDKVVTSQVFLAKVNLESENNPVSKIINFFKGNKVEYEFSDAEINSFRKTLGVDNNSEKYTKAIFETAKKSVFKNDKLPMEISYLKQTVKNSNEAGDWTGVIFAVYSVFAAFFSLAITPLANKYGRKNVYMASLIFGGLGLISMLFIQDKNILLIPMVGVGIAWAGILALPYAILSSSLPPKQTGVYMGLFNATITIPQIAAGLLGGVILYFMKDISIKMLVIAGVSMILAGICAKLFITAKENE